MGSVNILITGINGFIGRNLEGFINKHHPSWNVYGIDKVAIPKSNEFNLDLKDKNKLKRLLLKIKPDYVFHLAGSSHMGNFKKMLFSNVYLTYAILEGVKQIDNYHPRIIIPSSASEYGPLPPSRMPIKEDTPLRPISIYGFTKMMQSEISLIYARNGLDVVIARIFNIIGGNVPVSLSIGRFAFELASIKKKKKQPVLLTGSLASKRDFLDIDDVCNCLLAVASNGKQGEVYNICRGENYLLRDLLKKLVKISGLKNIKITEANRYGGITDSLGSTKKLMQIIKKFKAVSIEKSLMDTYEYYLSKV